MSNESKLMELLVCTAWGPSGEYGGCGKVLLTSEVGVERECACGGDWTVAEPSLTCAAALLRSYAYVVQLYVPYDSGDTYLVTSDLRAALACAQDKGADLATAVYHNRVGAAGVPALEFPGSDIYIDQWKLSQ